MESRVDRAIGQIHTVRDIPYKLGLDGDPNKLMLEKLGNCTRKCLYVAPRLEDEGYKVMLALVAFSWADLLPQFAHLLSNPVDTHMALLVKPSVGRDWVEVDPVWDPAMEQYGFPISEWDGISGTGYGVSPRNVRSESLAVFRTKTLALTGIAAFRSRMNIKHPTPFNDAVNEWLQR